MGFTKREEDMKIQTQKTTPRLIAAALLLVVAACCFSLAGPAICKAAETKLVKILLIDMPSRKTILVVSKPFCVKHDGEDTFRWVGTGGQHGNSPANPTTMCIKALDWLAEASMPEYKTYGNYFYYNYSNFPDINNPPCQGAPRINALCNAYGPAQ